MKKVTMLMTDGELLEFLSRNMSKVQQMHIEHVGESPMHPQLEAPKASALKEYAEHREKKVYKKRRTDLKARRTIVKDKIIEWATGRPTFHASDVKRYIEKDEKTGSNALRALKEEGRIEVVGGSRYNGYDYRVVQGGSNEQLQSGVVVQG